MTRNKTGLHTCAEAPASGTKLAGNGAARPLPSKVWYPLNRLHVCFGQQEEYAEAGK